MDQLGQFIIHHWGQWLTLLTVLILIFITESREQKNKGKSLSPQQAVIHLNEEKTKLIDLRDQLNFRKGHIINAVNMSADDAVVKMEKFKNKDIIFVCDKGLISQNLANKLRKNGFANPMVLQGGMNAWQNADLPLIKGK